MVQIRKRLKEAYGGGLKQFIYDDADCFEGVNNRQRFLNSQERALIVHSFLTTIAADRLTPALVLNQRKSEGETERVEVNLREGKLPF